MFPLSMSMSPSLSAHGAAVPLRELEVKAKQERIQFRAEVSRAEEIQGAAPAKLGRKAENYSTHGMPLPTAPRRNAPNSRRSWVWVMTGA